MSEEIWKDIKVEKNGITYDFTGIYKISNLGRVINKKGRILKPRMCVGYISYYLQNKGLREKFLAHRLVANAFIPNPNKLPFINHINENRADNRPENLEWCTPQYNVNYNGAHQKGAIKRLNGKKAIKVIQLDLNGNYIKEWPSTMEIERVLGFSNGNIGLCCRGTYKQAYGFKWKYKKEKTT